jgi:hypothetical protein
VRRVVPKRSLQSNESEHSSPFTAKSGALHHHLLCSRDIHPSKPVIMERRRSFGDPLVNREDRRVRFDQPAEAEQRFGSSVINFPSNPRFRPSQAESRVQDDGSHCLDGG